MTTICQILSTPADNLWMFEVDGRGIRRATEYMFPYIREKKSWPLKPDVMYDREWPMRQSSYCSRDSLSIVVIISIYGKDCRQIHKSKK